MNGGVSGEVYGEVIKRHLTIGNTDKQGGSAQFGEVLPCFSARLFSVYVAPVADGF